MYAEPLLNAALLNNPTAMMKIHGYAFMKATPASKQLAAAWEKYMQLRAVAADGISWRKQFESHGTNRRTETTGGVVQYPLDDIIKAGYLDSQLFEHVVNVVLESAGIHPAGRELTSMKMLEITVNGKGRQAIHFDFWQGQETLATKRVTIIIYFKQSRTTALPIFPIEYVTCAAPKENPHRDMILNRDSYHYIIADAGDILVLQQNVPHYGEACNSPAGRYVAFCQSLEPYSPREIKELQASKKQIKSDALQLFAWQYAEEAYGIGSVRWAEEMLAAYQTGYDPLGHALNKSAYDFYADPLLQLQKSIVQDGAEITKSYYHWCTGSKDKIEWKDLSKAPIQY